MEAIVAVRPRLQRLPADVKTSPACWQALCDFVLHHPLARPSDAYRVYGKYTVTAVDLSSPDLTPFLTSMLLHQDAIAHSPSTETTRCWHRPRLAGALRALCSLYLMADRDVTETRLMVHAYVYAPCDDAGDLSPLCANGIDDVEWGVIARLGCSWLRAVAAARAVQRGWRLHRLRQRAARLIQARWRFVVARPSHPVCQRRLRRELSGLCFPA